MRLGSVALAVALGAGAWLTAEPARACGGTFCDNAATPVDQTGENILFVQGDGFVEAHIQIQYDPEAGAERFAWVVPVTEVPELSVGSDALFDALAAATVPAFGFNRNDENCDPCDDDDDDGGIRLDLGGGGPPGDPNVVNHEIVGAFEMFVLEGGTSAGVMAWLGDNGFAQDPAAEPILDEYLADGFRFVAFKLAPGVGASEIHPVVLRYPGQEACVPIRLTRIAAADDMTLRTYFLGDGRAIPTNYLHVEPNLLRLNWLASAASYRELVTMAVDRAGGRAWITEFAGPSAVVNADAIVEADWWEVGALDDMPLLEALVWLRDRGYYWCASDDECSWSNPLLPGLLDAHLELPDDVDLLRVLHCPECFVDSLEVATWNPAAFTEAVTVQIAEPAQHARNLLDTWPYLTRMVTTLSPHEMTEDPLFAQNAGLPDVGRRSQLGTLNTFCDGAASFELPDGRLVALPNGSASWPSVGGRMMPWLSRVEQLVELGAPQEIADKTAEIDELLAAFNERHGARRPAGAECDDAGSDGEVSGDDAGDGLVTVGPMIHERRAPGCGCSATRQRDAGWLPALWLLGLGSFVRRRAVRRDG